MTSKQTALFTNSETLIIFTYAPAGLGHLRVTDALQHGLPESVKPLLLGADDTMITALHRITSINGVLRTAAEWIQQGAPEAVFSPVYRSFLRGRTDRIEQQLTDAIRQQLHTVKHVIIVATHFSLAHQIAAIKQSLQIATKTTITLAVVVTDDSPQRMWYVDGADMLFVPSDSTKQALQRIGKRAKNKPIMTVISYPISPELAAPQTKTQHHSRAMQLNPDSTTPIHIAVPISGAAVGTEYFARIMKELHQRSSRCMFHVVAKHAPFTAEFLQKISRLHYVQTYPCSSDREVVDVYEQLYEKEVIALEITKPSEQAFKSLLSSSHIGGSLLLLAKPVGRQEYDNIAFLQRHSLLPVAGEKALLHETFHAGTTTESLAHMLQESARNWRAITLRNHPHEDAQYIMWLINQHIAEATLQSRSKPLPDDTHAHELGSDGVAQFWHHVGEKIVG